MLPLAADPRLRTSFQFFRHAILASFSCVLTAATAIAQTPGADGRWSDPFLTKYLNGSSIGAVHMMLMYGGTPDISKVALFYNDPAAIWQYNATDNPCSTCSFPVTLRKEVTTSGFPTTTTRGLFCGSHAATCDGRMLIAGAELDYPGEGTGTCFYLDGRTSTPTIAQAASMLLPRYYAELTELGSGKMLATAGTKYECALSFGGVNASGTYRDIGSLGLHKNVAWATADFADSGNVSPPVPPATREGHTAVLDPGGWGRIVIFGGKSGSTVLDDGIWVLGKDSERTFVYHAEATSSWRNRVPSGTRPAARYGHTAVVAPDRQMILWGGRNNSTVFDDGWILDMNNTPLDVSLMNWYSMTLEAGPNGSPVARHGHSAVYVAGTPPSIYVMGGRDAAGDALSDTWELRLETESSGRWKGKWYKHADMPAASASHVAIIHGSAILLFGGENGSSASRALVSAANILRRYNISSDTYTTLTASNGPSPRSGHAGTRNNQGGTLVTYGGVTANLASPGTSDYSKEIWTYTIDSNTWTQSTATVPDGARRAGHTLVYGSYTGTARYPERFDPSASTMEGGQSLPGAWTLFHTTASRMQPSYNYMHVLPDGKVLYAGPADSTFLLNPNPSAASPWTSLFKSGDAAGGPQGFSVQYRPGSVMRFGGVNRKGLTDTIRVAVTNPTTNGWVQAGTDAGNERSDHHMTLLPTGDVLLTGGYSDDGTTAAGEKRAVRIWNAVSRAWGGDLAAEPLRRNHHASIVLLPDGRVLSAGGNPVKYGTNPDQDNQRWAADIYEPSYLFDAGGSNYATRPAITSAPTVVKCGTTFTVGTNDASAIHTVCLVKPSAVTHDANMDQRFVPLNFSVSGSSLSVTAPANTNIAPPGYYLLFIVKKDPSDATKPRTPSLAKWVQIVGNPTGNTISVSVLCLNEFELTFSSPTDAVLDAPTRYVVKASNSVITEANFDAALTIFDDAPANPGGSESLIWNAPGSMCERYYFSVRAYYGGCSQTVASTNAYAQPPCHFCDDDMYSISPIAPARLSLFPPVPNPTDGAMTIRLGLPSSGAIADFELALYDIAGRKLAVIEHGRARPGYRSFEWNPRRQGGLSLPSGHYFLRLRMGDATETRSIVLR